MFTLTVIGLLLFTLPGIAVLIGSHLVGNRFGTVETHTLSTRELPNVAADLGTHDTDHAHR